MTFKSNFFHIIEILNDSWNLTQTFNWTPLTLAAALGKTEVVRLLLSQPGIDINRANI